jgi:hypothetical protein
MKNIKTFEDFVNEAFDPMDHDPNTVWRNTTEEFLFNLLKNKKISSKGQNFVSISKFHNSGGQDNYGNVRIGFNKQMLIKQGLIEIYYDDPDFWEDEPLIAKHVTGFKNADEYYKDKGYEGPEEANEDGELTWEQYCEGFYDEAELVVPHITLKPGLITSIKSEQPLKDKTIELIKKLEIPIL